MPTPSYTPPLVRPLGSEACADDLGLPSAEALLHTTMHLLDEDDAALARDFLDAFVVDALNLAAELRASAEQNLREPIHRIAHTLKSTTALLGLSDLAARFAHLEDHATTLSRATLRGHVEAVTVRLDAIAVRVARPRAA